MKVQNYIITILIVTLTYSCSSIKVVKLNENSKIKSSGLIFNLPATQLNVNVEIVKIYRYKGPFSEFSEEYLGVVNNIKKDEQEFKISKITINPTIVDDLNSTYYLKNYSNKINEINFVEETKIINSINCKSNSENTNKFQIKDFSQSQNFIPFIDKTYKPLVSEKTDTSWKSVLVDSVFVRVPKINKAISPRTEKEQAYLASKFIFKIRKRRLRVLTGMDKDLPKGEAINQIMKNLNEMENEYISLFLGKTITDTAKYTFTITPDSNLTNLELFKFDTKNGISEKAKYSVNINFYDNDTSTYCKKINTIKHKKSKFPYKTPKYIKTDINLGSTQIYSKYLPIYQVGLINYISANCIKNNIIFDELTGKISIIKAK